MPVRKQRSDNSVTCPASEPGGQKGHGTGSWALTRSRRSTDIFHHYLGYCIYLLEARRCKNSALILPVQEPSPFSDPQITSHKAERYYLCRASFLLVCDIPSPKPPVRTRAGDTARGSVCRNPHYFGHSHLRRGCKGQRKKTHSPFPHPGRDSGPARSRSVPAWLLHPRIPGRAPARAMASL